MTRQGPRSRKAGDIEPPSASSETFSGGAAAGRTRRAGGLAATLTPTPQVAVADESASAMLRTGKELFDTSCVTCHGVNLQGVTDRGPSLVGVGEAAVYFQVSTGRMPAMRGEAQAPQKPPQFDESQIDAIGAYVQANGGGPEVPRERTARSLGSR